MCLLYCWECFPVLILVCSALQAHGTYASWGSFRCRGALAWPGFHQQANSHGWGSKLWFLELHCMRCLPCAGRMQRLYYWTMELVTDTLFWYRIIELYHGALIAASLLAFFFPTSVSKTSNSIQSDSYLIISHNLPIIFHHHQLLLSLSWFRIFQVAKATGENPFSSFHRFWIFLSHHLSHTCSSTYPEFSCLLKSTSHGHRFLGYLRRNR